MLIVGHYLADTLSSPVAWVESSVSADSGAPMNLIKGLEQAIHVQVNSYGLTCKHANMQ
jgi:hypothetical protein